MRTRAFDVTVMKRKNLLDVALHKDRFNGVLVLFVSRGIGFIKTGLIVQIPLPY